MVDGKAMTLAAEAALAEMGREDLFLVGVKAVSGDEFEVVLDSDGRVSVEDCIVLTKGIEQRFDRDVEDFSLTVMSSGVGEALVCERQFRKLLGKMVEIAFVNGKKFVKVLQGYDGESVTVDGEELSMDEIKTVKEHITFS